MILHTAGLAAHHPHRYDSPICVRLSGININQDEDPWWVSAALGWVGMYQFIQTSQWDQADAWRTMMDQKLKTEPPSFLFEFYKRFTRRLESWIEEQRRKGRN